jgi:hypothetical protein
LAQTPHLAYLTDGLGKHWEISPTPTSHFMRHRHPPVDRAALEIAQDLNTETKAVARVEIIANPAPWRSATADTERTRWRGM